jgi:hypothetical protein
MNADMLNRGTEDHLTPPLSLSLSLFFLPVKCNKSLYIFTHCIALLVYLITFEILKQSTINQKAK